MKEKNKLTFGTKVSYGLSEIGAQFSWTLVGSYLTLFYTDVVGLTPVIISMIMLGARIWDGVNDPMMGLIADRTKTRWGRFRPYLLFGAPVLALLNILTFTKLDVSMTGKTIYATVTYVLLGMAYTAICIAQGSLSNVMTRENNERMQLNTFRGIAAGVASLALSAMTMPMILHFGNGDTSSAKGYFMVALIFSCISIPCLWTAFAKCKEVIQVSESEQKLVSVLKSLKTIFLYRDFTLEIIFAIITLTAMFGRFGVMLYYYIYVLRKPELTAVISMIMSIAQILSQFFVPWLTSKLNKKHCLCIANLGMAAGCLLMYLAGTGTDRIALVFIGSAMLGFFNILSPVLYGLTAELVDAVELKTGVRADATGYSTLSFASKLGNAFGGSVGVVLLGAVGYVANANQTTAVKYAMSGVVNLAPMAMYLIALIPLLMIKMTNKTANENTAKLAEKA